MKEIWIGGPKLMQFRLVFFKNADWFILPCISFIGKGKYHKGSEIIFGFLQWRMSIYFHNWN